MLRSGRPSVSCTVDSSKSLSRTPISVISWSITHSVCAEAEQQWSFPTLMSGIRTSDARRWPAASAEFKELVEPYLCCPLVPSWRWQRDTCLQPKRGSVTVSLYTVWRRMGDGDITPLILKLGSTGSECLNSSLGCVIPSISS